ncbi:MAG TPA: hypothetical protein VMT71_18710 [Syntrophorhabdales bacterium]|nr:hypothetical protein [Syntrophorhabdales bacterium]
MEDDKVREDLYNDAKNHHTSLDLRLQMLLKKPFLTESEEVEVRELKKKKLYYKDLMEKLKKGQPEG